jgi:hypothetical protein
LSGGGMADVMATRDAMGAFNMIDDPVLLGFANDDLWIAGPALTVLPASRSSSSAEPAPVRRSRRNRP